MQNATASHVGMKRVNAIGGIEPERLDIECDSITLLAIRGWLLEDPLIIQA